jgi:hypothetical protein
MPRRLVRVALFAVTAAVAAWAAWPDSSVLHAAADQFGLIATVLLLAGLPLLARRFFGPVSDGRIARFLRVASNPWLRGSQADPLVALAWILLFGGPVAAGVLAARWYCRRPGRSIELARARIGQGFVAGVVANMVGALFGAVLGTSLIALTIKAAWLRPLVYHSPRPSAAAAYGHVLHASQHADSYITMCVVFPIIGLLMSALAAACLMPVPSQSGPQPGDGGGPPGSGPGPAPQPPPQPPPPGGRLADAEERVPVLS